MGAIVLLPLGVDDAALDRCLAALDVGTAAGTAEFIRARREDWAKFVREAGIEPE